MSDKNGLKTDIKENPVYKLKREITDGAYDIKDNAYNLNDNVYGRGKKPKRAVMTRGELVRGIVFSEIFGPPVSKRRRPIK